MPDVAPNAATWLLAGVQAIGLTSAWLARLSEGSAHQAWCQRLFLCCMLMLGLATIAALLTSPGTCVFAGATLAIMVLAATWDFSAGRETAL
jgi:uncharacterized membrane protein